MAPFGGRYPDPHFGGFRCSAHFRTYLSGWIGLSPGVLCSFLLVQEHFARLVQERRELKDYAERVTRELRRRLGRFLELSEKVAAGLFLSLGVHWGDGREEKEGKTAVLIICKGLSDGKRICAVQLWGSLPTVEAWFGRT